jgi:hypothetical protein
VKVDNRGITALAHLCLAFLVILVGCNGNRSEGRQQRLNTFRQTLPEDICSAFDSIEDTSNCDRVGLLLSEARTTYPSLDAKLDSIMHAELIDSFTDSELIQFFWYYFAEPIRTGTVPEP